MSDKKKTNIVKRYVEVYNIGHAEEISRLLNSPYRECKSNTHSRTFCAENHKSYWVEVPKGKWGFAKSMTKTVCGGQTSRCILFRFILFTDNDRVITKTS